MKVENLQKAATLAGIRQEILNAQRDAKASSNQNFCGISANVVSRIRPSLEAALTAALAALDQEISAL